MTSHTATSSYRPKLIESAFVDFISEHLEPFWSPVTPRVKLINRVWLNDNLVALALTPNPLWQHHLKKRHATYPSSQGQFHPSLWQAGQHIPLKVKIGSRYYHRSYSLVGSPLADTTLASPLLDKGANKISNRLANKVAAKVANKLTNKVSGANKFGKVLHIAIRPQGAVSNYLAYQAKIGEVFDCELPEGDFTLAHHHVTASQPIGFIASGSGITPMPGLIFEALHMGDSRRPVTLLYYHAAAPNSPVTPQANATTLDSHQNSYQVSHQDNHQSTTAEAAFADYWQQLAQQYPNFSYYLVNTRDPDSYIIGSRHISAEVLKVINLDANTTKIFACGASEMLESLHQIKGDDLAIEYFEPLLIPAAKQPDSLTSQTVLASQDMRPSIIRFRRRQRLIQTLASAQNILINAEAEGIQLPHGCRQGICNLCRCDKVSGVVKNIKTGELSHDGFESIKPCVSVAMTDLVLDI